MRTTVEITEDQRAELLRLAARRGLKGFSGLIQEALDHYLSQQGRRDGAIEAALALKGSLTDREADDLAERVSKIRETWR